MNYGVKQIFAIFRKDARHLWAEIVISLALLTALVVLYPRQWHHLGVGLVSHSFAGFFANADGAPGLLTGIIPISWWILLAHLIHDERLVGDTQFWITRPYRWPLLLAAKLLFIAAFIYLPLLIAQCVLLGAAGFPPLSLVPGLLFNSFLVSTFVVLPLLALATLTSNIARMTLAMLGVLLFFIGLNVVNGLVPTLASAPSLVSGSILFTVLLCGASAVILVQYARRRTRTAWLVLAAVAVVLSSGAFVDPDQPFVNRAYPPAPAGATAPAQFTLSANPMTQSVAHGSAHKDIIEIAVPLHIDGVAADSVVIPDAVQVTLDGAGSSHWTSPWQGVVPEKFLSGAHDTVFRFRMRRQDYENFRKGPIALRTAFAITLAHSVRSLTMPVPESRFQVPGFAMCTPVTGWDGKPITVGIACLSAMRQPQLTYISALWQDECGAQNAILNGSGWAGSLDSAPADFSLTGVWEVPMNLTNSYRYNQEEQRTHMRQLCPGTPLTFTTYALQARTRVELSVPNFRLPELSQATRAEYETQ